jgi:hypothetical protein
VPGTELRSPAFIRRRESQTRNLFRSPRSQLSSSAWHWSVRRTDDLPRRGVVDGPDSVVGREISPREAAPPLRRCSLRGRAEWPTRTRRAPVLHSSASVEAAPDRDAYGRGCPWPRRHATAAQVDVAGAHMRMLWPQCGRRSMSRWLHRRGGVERPRFRPPIDPTNVVCIRFRIRRLYHSLRRNRRLVVRLSCPL